METCSQSGTQGFRGDITCIGQVLSLSRAFPQAGTAPRSIPNPANADRSSLAVAASSARFPGSQSRTGIQTSRRRREEKAPLMHRIATANAKNTPPSTPRQADTGDPREEARTTRPGAETLPRSDWPAEALNPGASASRRGEPIRAGGGDLGNTGTCVFEILYAPGAWGASAQPPSPTENRRATGGWLRTVVYFGKPHTFFMLGRGGIR